MRINKFRFFFALGTCVFMSSMFYVVIETSKSSTFKSESNNTRRIPQQRQTGVVVGINNDTNCTQADGVRVMTEKKNSSRLVFLKTHKTGSTTVASIIQRYGYTHNKTFLVPTVGSFINYSQKFTESMIDYKWRNMTSGYDLLTNHARYDRREMSLVFPDARFVTIIRDPVSQFESAFYYFDIPDALPRNTKSLESFMMDPVKNFAVVQSKNQYFKQSLWNHMLFDFGVSTADMEREDLITEKILELDSNFDLVMICEYFDESLLLLKRLLGWSLDDVVYLTKTKRAAKYRHEMSEEVRTKIRAWNAGDLKLYQHFNRTFLEKVHAYGPEFETDLADLRKRLAMAKETCYNTRVKTTQVREEKFAARKDAPAWCKDMTRDDYAFTELIRKDMNKMKVPLYKVKEVYPRRKVSRVKAKKT